MKKSTPNKIKSEKLPITPGVYFFRDGRGKILYVGKATSLKDRTRSYFGKDLLETRGPLIVEMINKAQKLTFEKTESVLEALILEAKYIKKYKPPFNTVQKDDKSYNYIVITNEEYPRVLLVREKDLENHDYKTKTEFGPFPHGLVLKNALKIIRKIFPYRDKCEPNSGKLCFNAQIGLCSGICASKTSIEEYKKMIRNLTLFLEGKKEMIIKNYEKEMRDLAKKKKFEEALVLKKKIFALKHIQDVSLMKRTGESSANSSFRIEGYDVAHLSSSNMVGVMTVIINGKITQSEYRQFNIRSVKKSNDPSALREILSRRLNHSEWQFPDIIVVDGNNIQKNVAEEVIKSRGLKIAVVAVVKNEHHKPRAIISNKDIEKKTREAVILANSEAHRFSIRLHRAKRNKSFLF